MKITKEHYQYIKGAMSTMPREKVDVHREFLKGESKVGDLEMRLRWDWFNASVTSAWVCDELYPYMNDTHIDTALRKIVSELMP